MEKAKAKERIEKLKAEIWRLNRAYFTENKSLVPEEVRDSLKKELIQLETQFPDLITSDSPTQRVGAALDGRLPKVKHIHPKESLQDAFSMADLEDWVDQMRRALGRMDAEFEYETELKIDGLNMSLVYEHVSGDTYKFLRAVTRGNGNLYDAIVAYDATADDFAKKFVSLALIFQSYAVTFSPGDGGSVFVFPSSGL
jgi:DNA ligase (NAD+)